MTRSCEWCRHFGYCRCGAQLRRAKRRRHEVLLIAVLVLGLLVGIGLLAALVRPVIAP